MCVYTSASIDSRDCLHSKRSSWLRNRDGVRDDKLAKSDACGRLLLRASD